VYHEAIDQSAAEEDQEDPQLTDEEEVPAGEITDDEQGEEGASSSSSSSGSAFDGLRQGLREDFMDHHVSNLVLHKQRCIQELRSFSERTQQLLCRCQHCGDFQQHQPASEQQYEPLEVYLCTQLAMHRFKAPMLVCCGCGHPQQLRPLHISCFPGTASASGLRPGRADVRPVWFSLDLVQDVDSSTYHKADLSTYSYVEARREGWLLSQQVMGLVEEEGGWVALHELPDTYMQLQLPLTADTLRRQLADAVREYQYAKAALVTLAEEIPGWPTGKKRPCAACKSCRCHLSFDMIFKLKWLRRGKYTLSYQQPANSRRFISNSERSALLEQVDEALQQQRQLTPVAAAAAAAIPARLPDLSQQVSQGEVQAAADAAAAGLEEATSGELAEAPAVQDEPAADAAPDAAGSVAEAACGAGDCSNFKADRLLTPAPTKVMIVGNAGPCSSMFWWLTCLALIALTAKTHPICCFSAAARSALPLLLLHALTPYPWAGDWCSAGRVCTSITGLTWVCMHGTLLRSASSLVWASPSAAMGTCGMRPTARRGSAMPTPSWPSGWW